MVRNKDIGGYSLSLQESGLQVSVSHFFFSVRKVHMENGDLPHEPTPKACPLRQNYYNGQSLTLRIPERAGIDIEQIDVKKTKKAHHSGKNEGKRAQLRIKSITR